jgi:HAD superfamily hydrolase (TIGR01459 family)
MFIIIYQVYCFSPLEDGKRPYQGVIDTINELKQRNKKLVILSNSSKRRDNAVKMLTKLGFDPRSFDDIITSGDVSYRMLCGQDSSWDIVTKLRQQGKMKVFVFGSGDDDEEYCISSGWSLSSIHEADLIIARGTFTLNDGSAKIITKQSHGDETYNDNMSWILTVAAERRLPMLITNPDRVRPDEDLSPMPGAIGDAYEKLLGVEDKVLVKRIGKPYREVYNLALSNKDGTVIHPEKAIMVGDALETDVMGGTQVGCATLWVLLDGIHAQFVRDNVDRDAQSVLDTFNQKFGDANEPVLTPTYVIRNFRW